MSRLDHLAFRALNQNATAEFFIKAFGYKVQAEFEIFFNDEKTDRALCLALEPPEKVVGNMPFVMNYTGLGDGGSLEYHLAPEIFVSEGTHGSIVHDWCMKYNGGKSGIHHLAYQVPSVEAKMKEWREKGWAEFTTEQPLRCDGLTQVFTKPSSLTGVIFEFIEREGHGFCAASVKELMISTKDGNRL